MIAPCTYPLNHHGEAAAAGKSTPPQLRRGVPGWLAAAWAGKVQPSMMSSKARHRCGLNLEHSGQKGLK